MGSRHGPIWVAACALLALGAVAFPTTGAAVAATSPVPAPGPAETVSSLLDLTLQAGHPSVLFRLEGAKVVEASGILVSPDGQRYLMQQDAGNTAEIFVVDRAGRLASTVKVATANEDWEDLEWMTDAAGTRRLVIADTGDAFFVRRDAGRPPRTEYALITMAAPATGADAPSTQTARDVVRYPFVFSDGATHNVESLLIDPASGRPYLVDKKEQEGQIARIWRGPATWNPKIKAVFEPVAQVPVTGASAGTFSPDGRFIVIRNADTAYFWQVKGGDVDTAVAQAPIIIKLPSQQQGEGIAYTPDGVSLVVNSEGRGTAVWEINLPPAFVAPPAVAPATVTHPKPAGRSQRVPVGVLVIAIVTLVALGVSALVRRRRTLEET